MSACPRCGWEDSPCWRNARFYMYASTCRIEELEVFEPNIAKQLKEKTPIEIEPFYYKRTRFGWVYRTPIKYKDFLLHRKTVEGAGRFKPKFTRKGNQKTLQTEEAPTEEELEATHTRRRLQWISNMGVEKKT